MNIFYSEARGWSNVPNDTPIQESASQVLEIFRALDLKRGFLGIVLDANRVLQLMPEKGGKVQVELLDCSKPALDSSSVDRAFAEQLIKLTGEGKDPFVFARENISNWNHTDLPREEQ